MDSSKTVNENKSPRWLGIDYGEVRVGVAISDPLGYTARGLKTINRRSLDIPALAAEISQIVKEYAITGIVVGIPRRTDGKQGPSEDHARQLAQELTEITPCKIVLQDERFTTVLAGRIMKETGFTGKKGRQRKQIIDQIAAEIILQEYLESCRNVSN